LSKIIIILSALAGLIGGIIGGYFQSLNRKREKKFELLYDFRKDIYSKLHKITFINDSFGQARYDWQVDGIKKGAIYFQKEFNQWFDVLKEFYETTSWAIDKTVYDKLDKLLETAREIDAIFWSVQYEQIDINAKKVDELYFDIIKYGKEVRVAIQKDMEMSKGYKLV